MLPHVATARTKIAVTCGPSPGRRGVAYSSGIHGVGDVWRVGYARARLACRATYPLGCLRHRRGTRALAVSAYPRGKFLRSARWPRTLPRSVRAALFGRDRVPQSSCRAGCHLRRAGVLHQSFGLCFSPVQILGQTQRVLTHSVRLKISPKRQKILVHSARSSLGHKRRARWALRAPLGPWPPSATRSSEQHRSRKLCFVRKLRSRLRKSCRCGSSAALEIPGHGAIFHLHVPQGPRAPELDVHSPAEPDDSDRCQGRQWLGHSGRPRARALGQEQHQSRRRFRKQLANFASV